MPRAARWPAVALLLATLAAVASAGRLDAGETLVVPAGRTVLTKTEFAIDEHTGDPLPVTMTVSGSLTLHDEPTGSHSAVYKVDAFYCYEGCYGRIDTHEGLFLEAAGYDNGVDAITAFVKGNTSGHYVATPKYDPSHRYTFPFACDENSSLPCGRMNVSAIGTAGKDTGSFTLQFGGEDTSQPTCRVANGLRLGPAGGVVACKLDRVVFLEGTRFFRPAAESKEATVGQYVYFRAALSGQTLPVDLLLLFPKEVGKDGSRSRRRTTPSTSARPTSTAPRPRSARSAVSGICSAPSSRPRRAAPSSEWRCRRSSAASGST